MRILVADDDPVSRKLLEKLLGKWGHEAVLCVNGEDALALLRAPDGPRLALLDWMMPRMTGVEVCRQIRTVVTIRPPYIIMVTGRGRKDDLVEGLDSGANDYVTKPYDYDELRARIEVGRRVLELQEMLAERLTELQEALSHIRTLQGILPICSYCKKIRDDKNYWERVDHYLSRYSGVRFSHSICPECYETYVKPQLEELESEVNGKE